MKEEIIVSGRMNHLIDPQLSIWKWQIPVDLFFAALAAGLLFWAAYCYLNNKKENYKSVLFASILAPLSLFVALTTLFFDLHHKAYFWQLYTTLRIDSPMSWGSWTYLVLTPVSVIWIAIHLKELFPNIPFEKKWYLKPLSLIIKTSNNSPNWDWKYLFLVNLEKFFKSKINIIVYLMLLFSIILAVYTGILLSAFNARPLWNNALLGPLFLVSGLLGAASVILMISKDIIERKFFTKVFLILILIKLFFITHLFMGYLAGSQVQIQAVNMFLGGDYTMSFWIFVITLGLIVPGVIEVLNLKGKNISRFIAPTLILLGSLLLRFILVDAGQASRYLY